MTLATKPCACGRDGCVAVQRDKECNATFRKRKFASLSCARYHQNMTDPRMVAARQKAASETMRSRGYTTNGGALVTPVEWLDEPPVRLRLQRLAQGVSV